MATGLIDRGTYYEIEDCKPIATLDVDGNVTGMFYCPYIPKWLVDVENKDESINN
jgi:hypothetical protein